MLIALQPMEELRRMEEEVRQRPNGVRVSRLLRELFFVDGKLASSLRQSVEFSLTTFALVAAVVLPVLVLALLPSAQSELAPIQMPPAVVDADAEKSALVPETF